MGTEAFWVPTALTALSAGANYVNTNNANSRQQAGEVQSIIDQQKLQSQGGAQVKALTNQIATDTPSQIAGKATGDYVSALRKNAAGTQTGSGNTSSVLFGQPTSSLPTSIKASSRYGSGTAASQKETQDFGNTLAGEMGQIDAATRQRQNEGLAQGTLGTNLNLLGVQSYTKNFADQLRAQASGQQSPWLALASQVAGGVGNAMSKNIAPSTPGTAGAVLGNGSIGGTYGLPGSTSTVPPINPWFDTSQQSAP